VSIRLSLPLPPSANRHWRHYRGRTVLSDEAETFREQVAWLVADQCVPALLPTTRWKLRATVYLSDWRRDIDNCAKELVDSLALPLGLNDRYLLECSLVRGDNDKANPRVEVQIEWEV